MVVGLLFVLLLFMIPVSVCRAQESEPPQEKPQTAEPVQAAPAVQENPAVTHAPQRETHPRLFKIFPTYDISNVKTSAPLSARGKFRLFVRSRTDPYTFADVAISAALSQANNNLREYGQGAAGYGKRLGAGLASSASSGFFGTFLFPSLLHEDPRYFRAGEGPFKQRLFHALIRPVVTRKDSGGNTFNWSGILGRIATNGLSNAYLPKGDTGAGLVFSNAAIATAVSATGALFNEFGPDLERKIFAKRLKPQPSAPTPSPEAK